MDTYNVLAQILLSTRLTGQFPLICELPSDTGSGECIAAIQKLIGERTVIRIRLTRKLAECLNGVDVSAFRVGSVIELPDREAAMMISEGWAEPVADKTVDHPLPMNRPAIQRT